MSTGGRSSTWCLVMLRWIRRVPILVTAPIGIATSLRPHMCPSLRSTWVTWWPPYLAVGRTDGQPAVYLYLAEWDGVDGDLLRGFRSDNLRPRVQRQPAHLVRVTFWMAGGVKVRHGLALLSGPERLELG